MQFYFFIYKINKEEHLRARSHAHLLQQCSQISAFQRRIGWMTVRGLPLYKQTFRYLATQTLVIGSLRGDRIIVGAKANDRGKPPTNATKLLINHALSAHGKRLRLHTFSLWSSYSYACLSLCTFDNGPRVSQDGIVPLMCVNQGMAMRVIPLHFAIIISIKFVLCMVI